MQATPKLASLEVLSKVLGKDVRAVFLVMVAEPAIATTAVNLCFARHSLCILDMDMRGAASGGFEYELPYGAIMRAELRDDSPEQFTLISSAKGLGKVIVVSSTTSEIVKELRVHWKADHMYRTLRNANLPIEHHTSSVRTKHSIVESMCDLSKHTRRELRGYYFYVPSHLKPVKSEAWRFCSREEHPSTAENLEVMILDPTIASTLSGMELLPSVQVVQNLAHAKALAVSDYKVLAAPSIYHKRFNFAADLAAWEGATIQLRTKAAGTTDTKSQLLAERDVCVVLLQRKYIPPSMLQAQTIAVVHAGRKGDFGNRDHYMRCTQAVADSITATQVAPDADRTLVQAQLDALAANEGALSWLNRNLRMEPRTVLLAKKFVRAIVIMLEKNKIPGFTARAVYPSLEVGEDKDALYYASAMERDHEGIPPSAMAKQLPSWRRRVWRFLAWCVDGGLLPGVLSLGDLVAAIKISSNRRMQMVCRRLVETLLYLHPVGGHYEWAPIMHQTNNPEIMRNFRLNELVLIRLLETGYVQQELIDPRDLACFPRFLARILRMHRNFSERLISQVCKEFVQLSLADFGVAFKRGNEPTVMNIIVPVLVEMAELPNMSWQAMTMAALVNFAKGSDAIKSRILAAGGARLAVALLRSRNNDTARHAAALVNACAKLPLHRRTLGVQGCVAPLVRLIAKDDSVPHFGGMPLVVSAIAALGNLAIDDDLRDRITESMGMEYSNRRGKRIAKSHLIAHVVSLLDEPELQDVTKRTMLSAKVMLLLKHLAAKNDDNKLQIGSIFMRRLMAVLTTSSSSEELLSALQLLYILSFMRDNCILMLRLYMEPVLRRFVSGNGTEEVRQFAKQVLAKTQQVGEALLEELEGGVAQG